MYNKCTFNKNKKNAEQINMYNKIVYICNRNIVKKYSTSKHIGDWWVSTSNTIIVFCKTCLEASDIRKYLQKGLTKTVLQKKNLLNKCRLFFF